MMETPDLTSLYELFRQMYSNQLRPSQLPRLDPEAQNRDAAGVSANYIPTGGVLGYLRTPPATVPTWMQSAMPAGVGLRTPLLGARFGSGRGLLIPDSPRPGPDMPDPHLEN